ncbi:MAG: hypothetical protein ACR2P6_02150 [Gammaproteobacteria bacterium]
MTIFKRIDRSIAVLVLFAGVMTLVVGGDRLWAGELGEEEVSDIRAELLSRSITPMLGGDGSVETTGPRAFRSVLANTENSLLKTYLFGQRFFDATWDHEPMVSPVLDGLGPLFNGTSCSHAM